MKKHLLEIEFQDNVTETYLYDEKLRDATSKLLKSDFIDNITELSNTSPIKVKINFSHTDFTKFISDMPDVSSIKISEFFGKDITNVAKKIPHNSSLKNILGELNKNPEYYHKVLIKHKKALGVEYDYSFQGFTSGHIEKIETLKSVISKKKDNIFHFGISEIYNAIKLNKKITREEVKKIIKIIKVYDFKRETYLGTAVFDFDIPKKNKKNKKDNRDDDNNSSENTDSDSDEVINTNYDSDCGTHSDASDNGYHKKYKYVLKLSSNDEHICRTIIKVHVHLDEKVNCLDLCIKLKNEYTNINDGWYLIYEMPNKPYLKQDFNFKESKTWNKNLTYTEKEESKIRKVDNLETFYGASKDFLLALHSK